MAPLVAMSAFSEAERAYLAGGRHSRGSPRSAPTAPRTWCPSPSCTTRCGIPQIDVGGYELELSKKFRDIARSGRAAIVIDDLASRNRGARADGVRATGRGDRPPDAADPRSPGAGRELGPVSETLKGEMDDQNAIAALVNDLYWQVDQLKPRGIKGNAGTPYDPAHYKRGLQNAIDRGGLEVAEYVRGYLYKSPSDGYKKLADADSLDLACEALVADDTKPYAHLFTDEDRSAARHRLAPHIDAIEARKPRRGRESRSNEHACRPISMSCAGMPAKPARPRTRSRSTWRSSTWPRRHRRDEPARTRVRGVRIASPGRGIVPPSPHDRPEQLNRLPAAARLTRRHAP